MTGDSAQSGILPDHPVTPTVDDFLAGIDSQLEFSLKLIQASGIAHKAGP
jgi:hypothetical protein